MPVKAKIRHTVDGHVMNFWLVLPKRFNIPIQRELKRKIAALMVRALKGLSGFNTGLMKNKEPSGKSFAPLSETTMDIRKKRGIRAGADQILKETRKHIYNQIDYKIEESKVRAGVFSEDKWIAGLHDKGYTTKIFGKKTVKVPSRKIFGFSKVLEEKILKELKDHFYA